MASARIRYLIRRPRIVHVDRNGKMWLVGGEWERVWSKKWHAYRGEKKMVTGRVTLLQVKAQRGWE